MHTKLTKLSEDKIAFLENLSDRVDYRSNNIRVGASGPSKMSVYSYSKWYDWNRNQRRDYKACFIPEVSEPAMMGWFLKFPQSTGFLDRMTYWVGNRLAANVTVFALKDQEIILDNNIIRVPKGEGLKFNLAIPHEIKLSQTEMRWACLMSLK